MKRTRNNVAVKKLQREYYIQRRHKDQAKQQQQAKQLQLELQQINKSGC